MKMTLYGVLGTLPGGDSDCGKNSTCIVVEDNQKSLIIDAGSGLLNYMRHRQEDIYHLLFTHYHLDHVLGLPFIPQLYDPNKTISLYGPTLDSFSVSELLPSILIKPFVPINIDRMKASIHSFNVIEDKNTRINSFEVTPIRLKHPGGCFGYRISNGQKTVVILTDFEIVNEEKLVAFCKDADAVYIDSFYTSLEKKKVGNLGHTTLEDGIDFFNKTTAKRLILGHHHYTRQLSELEELETEKIIIAREGFELEL